MNQQIIFREYTIGPDLCELVDATPVPLLLTDPDGKICDANRAVEELTGIEALRFINTPLSQWLGSHAEVTQLLAQVACDEPVRNVPLLFTGVANASMPVLCNANFYPIGSGSGRIFITLQPQDPAKLNNCATQAAYRQCHDPLTGTLTREQTRKRLFQSITETRGAGQSICLLHLGIDNFKDINDAFGQFAGDEVLKEFSTRVEMLPDRKHAVGRLSSDEFALIINDLEDHAAILALLEPLTATLKRPYRIDGRDVTITCCIGIAVELADRCNADTILRNAAIALHHAKREGRNSHKFFTAEMRYSVRRRMEICNEMLHALNRDEYSLAYQPRFSVGGNSIAGIETLIRWENAALGPVSPAEFIPVAENSGHIVAIGEWVLNKACMQAAEWWERTGKRVNIAVNLSARQLRENNIVQQVANALARSAIPPQTLEIELTESMLISDINRVMSTLHGFKELGVRIAVDDFGTGYSSLSYLKRFPLDYLKIDRSFTTDIPGNSSDEAIVRAIIAMAESLCLSVIAEGVENRQQLEFLYSHGCDEMQGFYFARPMPAEAITELLQQQDVFGSVCSTPTPVLSDPKASTHNNDNDNDND